MREYELTDKEILDALGGWSTASGEAGDAYRAVAKAQAKKLVVWLDRYMPTDFFSSERIITGNMWHKLYSEVESDKRQKGEGSSSRNLN